MNKEQRALLRDRATKMHHAYQSTGDHAGQRVCEIAIAALNFADNSTPQQLEELTKQLVGED